MSDIKNKPSNTIYVSNLSYERDRNGLKSLFIKFGSIKNIKIVVEPTSNQSRGMAFIEYGSIKEATDAIKAMDRKIVDGRTMKVSFAIPLRKTSTSKDPEKKELKKDLEFKSVQLAKKARNEAKRKSNPLVFKLPTKKKSKT